MPDPWQIYDELIDAIPAEITVTAANIGLQWCRVTSSEGGIGMAYSIPERSRPAQYQQPTMVGARLVEIARLAKSWNLAEAGIGVAAINAYLSEPKRAAENGFQRSGGEDWQHIFNLYAERVADARVAVIGHFPFGPEPLGKSAELFVLERHTFPGDFPDPACEYLLPGCDFVFISSSSFVNKTAPRLLELASGAHTVMVGPSTPLSPRLFDHGADMLTGFVSPSPAQLDEALSHVTMAGMYDAGYRVEQASPSR